MNEGDGMPKEEKESCCVLQLRLYPEPWQVQIIETRFKVLEHLKNSLIALELRKLRNLERTRAYREIQEQIKLADDKSKIKLYAKRRKLLKDAGFSEFVFKDDITPMQKHFAAHIATHVAHRAASEVWRAFDKFLFGNGKMVHYVRRGTLRSASNQTAGTTMTLENGYFKWNGGRDQNSIAINIRVAKPTTYYEKEMLQKKAKYFRIVRKWGKIGYKYYLQITLAGLPAVKPRLIANEKKVGIDIGPSSIAIVSDKKVELRALADKVQNNHIEKCSLQRSMDRSRRNLNPQNYNEDGIIRRGIRLNWTFSKHYIEMRGKVRMLERKNVDIRKYQHTCLANEVILLGTDVYIEQMSFKGLQRRAKETTYREDGRPKRKKRFGKSIANRAPAMFVEILGRKLTTIVGTELNKVDTFKFRASQYDHTNGSYKKKLLKERWAQLSNGDRIQRDLYSAFLLKNSNADLNSTNVEQCNATYDAFKIMHDDCITKLKSEKKSCLPSFGV